MVIAEISPTKVGEKWRLLTLTEFSKRWNYTQLEQNLKKLEKKVLVHKKCCRDFTDIKRSLQYSDVTTSKPKKIEIQCCFLCSKEAKRDDQHSSRKQIFNVTLIPFRRKNLEPCRNRNDEMTNIAETRINCSNDLVADEFVYHKECLTRFMLN